ncbi:MAG: hypothetical protein WBP83_01405, partial [Nitrososphaeraceae archaeon]
PEGGTGPQGPTVAPEAEECGFDEFLNTDLSPPRCELKPEELLANNCAADGLVPNFDTMQCEAPQPAPVDESAAAPPVDEGAAAPPADEGGDGGDGGDTSGDGGDGGDTSGDGGDNGGN